jgi:DNA-directed RNA polymerase subunit RPC12/RpoP
MTIKQLIIMWIIYSDDPNNDQIQNGPYGQNLITNCDHKVRPKSTNSEDNVMVRCQQCGSKKLAMLQDSTWQTRQRKNLLVVENSPFIHEILLK